MAKVRTQIWTCDGPGCSSESRSSEDASQYWDVPPGWIAITITGINEEEECTCKCQEEECDDDGDNVAGHESYDCECDACCPDDTDMEGIFCESCARKFKMMFDLPRSRNKTGIGRIM